MSEFICLMVGPSGKKTIRRIKAEGLQDADTAARVKWPRSYPVSIYPA